MIITARVESAAIHECWGNHDCGYYYLSLNTFYTHHTHKIITACLLWLWSWSVGFLLFWYGLLLDILDLWVYYLVRHVQMRWVKSWFIVCGRLFSSVCPIFFALDPSRDTVRTGTRVRCADRFSHLARHDIKLVTLCLHSRQALVKT